MRRLHLLALVFSLIPATGLRAQSAADSAAVLTTARNYIDAIWENDSVRMRRALHPDLAKRQVRAGRDGGPSTLSVLTAEQMVASAGRNQGAAPSPQRKSDITIQHMFGNMAAVMIDAGMWVDYMHLAKWNGEYKIVNVLFDFRPRS